MPQYRERIGPCDIRIDLLALAAAHGGCLVTFDRAISTAPVPGAAESDLVILSSAPGPWRFAISLWAA